MKYPYVAVLLALLTVIQSGCEDETPEPDYGPSQNLIFHETFEGPEPFSNVHNLETGDWSFALQYVDSISYDGNRSARFEIREDQPMVAQGKRSEVTVIMGTTNDNLTQSAWYSYAVYFPGSFHADTTYDVISQWYHGGSPVRFIAKRDKLFIEIGNDSAAKEKLFVADIVREQWHELVFNFYHSPNEDGSVNVWYNGEQKISRAGGNLYNDFLPKWKIGIYKSSFETGTSLVRNRVVYFDNVKVGNHLATYRDMEPWRP